jgi:hypothetical protein
MEPLAIRDGIQQAIECGFQDVQIETDAQEIIKMIEDPGGGRSSIVGIHHEVMELRGFFLLALN